MDELVTAGWLWARGAVEDKDHPGEWFLPFVRNTHFGDQYRLVVDLKDGPGVTWESIAPDGQTVECVTLVFAGMTCGRLVKLCEALDVPFGGQG